MQPETMAMADESQSNVSPIAEIAWDCKIEASIVMEMASICVAVLNLDRNSVLKLHPENSAASLTPEIIISRHNITAAGMTA